MTSDYQTTIAETIKHIERVQDLIGEVVVKLQSRANLHDQSKLEEPELTGFATASAKLKDIEYMSPEYKEVMVELNPTVDHHYAHNRHHPEYHPNGIRDMNLVDLIEMLCDWKAASERHKNGDIMKSIELNQKRFGYSDEIKQLLTNSVPLILERS